MKSAVKNIFPYFITILLFSSIIFCQKSYDAQKKRSLYIEPLVLKAEIVKAFDLGLHNAAADLAWLTAIQYLGGSESKNLEKLDNYLWLSVDLDPKFSYPYAFGALLLPAFNQVDEAIKLAEKGVNDSTPDWRIPYYLATTYFTDKDDKISAAKYFDVAARTPGAPSNIQFVASNFGSRPDLRSQTKLIWQGILQNSNDEVVIDQAKKYLVHLELLDMLEIGAREYKNKYGNYPKEADDLTTGKVLLYIPEDPFGFSFQIDQETGRVSAKFQ
ncbi:MAG: hypothetical protein WCT32_02880 [Patescibacteria group bacterium]|jgi:hypothetical protein